METSCRTGSVPQSPGVIDSGELFPILRGYGRHVDGAGAVGTRFRRRRAVGLVDPRWRSVASLSAVLRSGAAARRPAPPCGRSLAKGAARRLPARRASSTCFLRCSLRRFHRSRVVRARSSFSFAISRSSFSMRLSRESCSPGRLPTAVSAAPAGHAPRTGTAPRSCTPLQGSSRPTR